MIVYLDINTLPYLHATRVCTHREGIVLEIPTC